MVLAVQGISYGLPPIGYMVWGQGTVKNLLGQLAEQMSGILGTPRAGGNSLRKSDLGKLKQDITSSLLLSERLNFFFFLSWRLIFPCPRIWVAD